MRLLLAMYLFVGLMVIGPIITWLLVAGSRLRRVVGVAVLLSLEAALFAGSQLQSGVLSPPLLEWAVGCCVAGSVVALVLHWAWQRGSAASAVVRSRSRSLMVLAAPLPLVILTCCVGSLRESAGEQPEGLFWTYIESSEYLPLPAETQLLNSDYNGVSQGPAILELTVAATDAATPEQLATRLAGHYSTHGWHMSAVRVFDGVKYRGCRRVQGLIRWADHCMTFHDGRTERWILVSISIDGMSDHRPSTTPRG